MDFDIPQDMQDYLQELDDFIAKEILPLQMKNENNRFFDHRREDARTDWERGGLPNEEKAFFKATRGTLYKYIKTVKSASDGCVTDE